VYRLRYWQEHSRLSSKKNSLAMALNTRIPEEQIDARSFTCLTQTDLLHRDPVDAEIIRRRLISGGARAYIMSLPWAKRRETPFVPVLTLLHFSQFLHRLLSGFRGQPTSPIQVTDNNLTGVCPLRLVLVLGCPDGQKSVLLPLRLQPPFPVTPNLLG